MGFGDDSPFSSRVYHKTGTSCKDIIVFTVLRGLLWAVYTGISMTDDFFSLFKLEGIYISIPASNDRVS